MTHGCNVVASSSEIRQKGFETVDQIKFSRCDTLRDAVALKYYKLYTKIHLKVAVHLSDA
jgi:hypothetical protein